MATASLRACMHAPFSGSQSHAARQQQPRRLTTCFVSCAQRMVPTTTQQCHQQPSTASAQHKGSGRAHHDQQGGSAGHHPAASRHMVLTHTASVSCGPHPTQSYESSMLLPCEVSVLEQFGLGGVSDYPKVVSALTLVSCSTLRPPATALLGLALLEEATQLHYDLVSLE